MLSQRLSLYTLVIGLKVSWIIADRMRESEFKRTNIIRKTIFAMKECNKTNVISVFATHYLQDYLQRRNLIKRMLLVYLQHIFCKIICNEGMY